MSDKIGVQLPLYLWVRIVRCYFSRYQFDNSLVDGWKKNQIFKLVVRLGLVCKEWRDSVIPKLPRISIDLIMTKNREPSYLNELVKTSLPIQFSVLANVNPSFFVPTEKKSMLKSIGKFFGYSKNEGKDFPEYLIEALKRVRSKVYYISLVYKKPGTISRIMESVDPSQIERLDIYYNSYWGPREAGIFIKELKANSDRFKEMTSLKHLRLSGEMIIYMDFLSQHDLLEGIERISLLITNYSNGEIHPRAIDLSFLNRFKNIQALCLTSISEINGLEIIFNKIKHIELNIGENVQKRSQLLSLLIDNNIVKSLKFTLTNPELNDFLESLVQVFNNNRTLTELIIHSDPNIQIRDTNIREGLEIRNSTLTHLSLATSFSKVTLQCLEIWCNDSALEEIKNLSLQSNSPLLSLFSRKFPKLNRLALEYVEDDIRNEAFEQFISFSPPCLKELMLLLKSSDPHEPISFKYLLVNIIPRNKYLESLYLYFVGSDDIIEFLKVSHHSNVKTLVAVQRDQSQFNYFREIESFISRNSSLLSISIDTVYFNRKVIDVNQYLAVISRIINKNHSLESLNLKYSNGMLYPSNEDLDQTVFDSFKEAMRKNSTIRELGVMSRTVERYLLSIDISQPKNK